MRTPHRRRANARLRDPAVTKTLYKFGTWLSFCADMEIGIKKRLPTSFRQPRNPDDSVLRHTKEPKKPEKQAISPISGQTLAILMLRATGLETDQASQIDFVRSHNTGIWSVCFLAFAFSFTSLMLFPQPGHRFSLFFLIFTALYFASYLVFLRYFCGEDLGKA